MTELALLPNHHQESRENGVGNQHLDQPGFAVLDPQASTPTMEAKQPASEAAAADDAGVEVTDVPMSEARVVGMAEDTAAAAEGGEAAADGNDVNVEMKPASENDQGPQEQQDAQADKAGVKEDNTASIEALEAVAKNLGWPIGN